MGHEHASAPTAGEHGHSRAETVEHIAHPAHAGLELAQRVVEAGHHGVHAPAVDVGGGGLGAAELLLGAMQVDKGVESGNGTDVVQGGLGALSGTMGMYAALGGGLGPLGVAATAGAAGFGLGRTLDEGVGKIMGEAGSTRTMTARGAAGGNTEVRDDRAISARLSDASHTAAGDSAARSMSSSLPVWLGGEGRVDDQAAKAELAAMAEVGFDDVPAWGNWGDAPASWGDLWK